METTDLFKKYKLVPTESNTAPMSKVERVEQQLRNYNPSLRAMANNFTAMQNALHSRKRGLTAKSRLNLLNANRARLQYIQNLVNQPSDVLASLPDASSDIPMSAEVPSKKKKKKNKNVHLDMSASIMETPEATPAKLPKPDIDELMTEASEVINVLPTRYKANIEGILSEAPGALRRGQHGEIVIRNKPVPGTSFKDVMRALHVNTNATSTPAGLKEAVAELKRLGVSRTLLGSRRARRLYEFNDSAQTGSGRPKAKKRACKVFRKVLRLY